VDSARKAADQAGVQIVTGDTKVVEKGSCDKLFINTSGIGILPEYLHLGVRQIRPDDRIIISGTVADHGMAILTKRKGLSFQSGIQSDTAALNDLIRAMLESGGTIHALRDPTRGGVATTLNEFASRSRLGIRVYEETIPINEPVRGACEILGIDPLYVANEGKLIAAVAAEKADLVLQAMRNHPLGAQAAVIGKVTEDHPQKVVMESQYGTERIIDMPVGEQLPRIC
jgi:hydrogenase expression/formation protein HypE